MLPVSQQPLSIRVLFRLSQVCGATPVNLQIFAPQQPTTRNRTRLRHLTNVLHFIWTAAIYAAVIYGMYKQYQQNASLFSSYRLYLNLCDFGTALTDCTIAMVGSNWQRSQFAHFGSTLTDLDGRLAAGFHTGSREFRIMALQLSAFMRKLFAGGAVVLVGTVAVICSYSAFRFEPMMVSWMAHVMPSLVAVLALMQYCCALFMVRQRFDCVATALREERRRADGAGDKRHTMVANDDGNDKGSLLLARLALAQRLYRDLGDVESSLHRSFGILMVSTAVTSILMVTIELYQFYTLIDGGMMVTWLIHSIDWLLLHVGKVWVGLYVCTMVGDAVRWNGRGLRNGHADYTGYDSYVFQKTRVATALHRIRIANDFGVNSGLLTMVLR